MVRSSTGAMPIRSLSHCCVSVDEVRTSEVGAGDDRWERQFFFVSQHSGGDATSCALLLRRDGLLHVLEVDVDGVSLTPFEERVVASGTDGQRVCERDDVVAVAGSWLPCRLLTW